MSGGKFEYKQFFMEDIAEQISHVLRDKREDYTPETLEEMKKAVVLLEEAFAYVHRIDWLLSDDDDEDTFHSHLKNDLEAIKKKRHKNNCGWWEDWHRCSCGVFDS